jgi:hypothetical protein
VTGRPTPARLTRVRAWLLAALAAVGLLVFSAGTTSAHTLPDAGNRVRASTPETITAVGVSEHVRAGQGRGPPVLQSQIVVATGVAAESAAGAAERLLGEPHMYVDLTRGGAIRNVGTDATHSEFADKFTSSGWTSRTSSDGVVQIFQKDWAKYVLRSKNSSGCQGRTADFTPAGAKQHILEIRLGYTP